VVISSKKMNTPQDENSLNKTADDFQDEVSEYLTFELLLDKDNRCYASISLPYIKDWKRSRTKVQCAADAGNYS